MSCDIWNSTEINPPLTNTYESKVHDIDFPNVHALLSTGIQTLAVPKVLLVESCVMKKVIYKLKLQLRHDKGFKLFESTSRYLQHFFDLEISKALKYFSLFFPQKYEKIVTLPSRQMLEYVLVRLQGYAQVCARIVETTFKCINFMKMRLVLGHQWEIALVITAITSRIWCLCRYYAMKSCFLYNNVLPLLDKLELTGNKWLPDLYKFPTELKTWLEYDWLIDIPNIVGIPKFALSDDLEFIGRYHHTYITDDSDDDESNDVKFICNLSNKKITLNKKQVKYLQSRLAISVDDSDSEENNLVPSSEYDDIFEILDADIQIKDSQDSNSIYDDTVAIDDKINENKNVELRANESNDLLNIEEKIMEDLVEDKNNTGEPVDEEFIIISDSEEKNSVNVIEGDKDVGEPITRHEIEEQKVIEEQEEMEGEYNEDRNNEKQEENVEEAVEYNEEEMQEIKKPIKIFEKLYNFDTIEKIKSLLQSENLNRKTDKRELCLFVHISDNLWYHIEFHIKYFIAMTIDNSQNRNKYLIKSKNLLSSITLENTTSLDYMPTLKNKFKAVDDPAPMTLKGKEYLINSIDSLSDLQVFIAKDIHKRTKSVEKSLFSNFNFEEWTQICTKIKYLIVMGIKEPIRSKVYLKKAKAKLTQLLLNKQDYASDLNIEVEELRQENNFDNIYKSFTQEDSCSQLFKYIQEIEDFVYPPKMINALKEKIGGQPLKTLNWGDSSANKKITLTNSSSQYPTKYSDDLEQPTTLGGNSTHTDYNTYQQIQFRAETNAASERLFESALTTESYAVPTFNKKLLRRQRMEELEAKRNTIKRPAPIEQNALAVPSKLRILETKFKTKMDEEQLKRQIEKAKNLEEHRKKIENFFQVEDEEQQRFEHSLHLFLHTPEQIDARKKLLEDKINKVDEIWSINEEIIDELEKTRSNVLTCTASNQNVRRNKRRRGKKLNQNNIPNEPQSFQRFHEEQYMRTQYQENLHRQYANRRNDYYRGQNQNEDYRQQPYGRDYGQNYGGGYGGYAYPYYY